MKKVNILLLLLLAAASAFARENAVVDSNRLVVTTKYGKVKGIAENGVYVWKGIRYAKAPVGPLRFRAPQAPDVWSGIKDANQFGASAPQVKNSLSGSGPQSEDCLFLNVWAPANDGKKRPVMFWIHGGGFVIGTGSSPLYDGAHFVKNGDVVIVTINYRLGPLGFLYFNDATLKNDFENNLGIKDQVAALKWVRDNIAAFGGDPDQVTIFGESAGGTSVETLLATPMAKGLFKRAIAESGPPAIAWNRDTALGITKKYLEILGIKPGNLQALKTLPLDTLRSAEEKLLKYMVAETQQKVFSPTIDGELLPKDIFSCLSKEQCGDVALLIGTNRNESTMFAKNKLKIMPSTAEGLQKYLSVVGKDNSVKITSAYKTYPNKSGVLDILTDAIFRVPAIRLAECHSQYAPVYMYRFEWTSSALNTLGLRSFHGLEIPFVFGNVDHGFGKILHAIATRKLIHRLGGEMQQAWINFAKYGDPNGPSGGKWNKYTVNDRTTMLFSRTTKTAVDPDGDERKVWDGIKYY